MSLTCEPSVDLESVTSSAVRECQLPYSRGDGVLARSSLPFYAYEEASGMPSPHEVASRLYLGRYPARSARMNQLLPAWGLLALHDLVDLRLNTSEVFQIQCAPGVVDEVCPEGGGGSIPYYKPAMGLDETSGTMQPVNLASAFFDADNLYGRTEEQAQLLREGSGGRVRLDQDGLPPVLLDDRVNRHPLLLVMYTSLLREHNRRAAVLSRIHPDFSDEVLYQAARLFVVSKIQHISFTQEYFPIVVGQPPSKPADDDAAFSTSNLTVWEALSLRHVLSMVPSTYTALDPLTLQPQSGSPFSLRDAPSSPPSAATELVRDIGLGSLIWGALYSSADLSDATFARDVVEFRGADAMLDIQLARDLEIPLYNELRQALGLSKVESFGEITSDEDVAQALEELYGTVDLIEGFVGAMAEDPFEASLVGASFRSGLWSLQSRVRYRDPHYHSHDSALTDARFSTLARLLEGSSLGYEEYPAPIPDDSFFLKNLYAPDGGGLGQFVLEADRYKVTWSTDADKETMTVNLAFDGSIPGNGYFAFAIGKSMPEADFVFVSIVDGECVVSDRHAEGYSLPIEDDVNNLLESSCESGDEPHSWTATFTRLLVPEDLEHDVAVNLDETQRCIWSYNEMSFDSMHTQKGVVAINFGTGEAYTVPVTSDGFFALHGVIMLLGFAFALPLAIMIARYRKHRESWIDYHVNLASLAVEVTIPIAIAALFTQGTLRTMHGKLGMAIVVLCLLQFTSGHVRLSGIRNRCIQYFGHDYGLFHQVNKVFHKWMGRCILILGGAQLIIGAHVIKPANTLFDFEGSDQENAVATFDLSIFFNHVRDWLLYSWIGFLTVTFAFLELRLRKARRFKVISVKRKLHLPVIDDSEFHSWLLRGQMLVTVHDAVVDISDFMKSHPGGSRILKEYVGRDCTMQILGRRPAALSGGRTGQQIRHAHTKAAWKVIEDKTIAYLGGYGSDYGLSGDGQTSIAATAGYVPYTLTEKRVLTFHSAYDSAGEDVYLFVFKATEVEEAAPLSPLYAGSYFNLRVVHNKEVINRSYTPIASLILDGSPAWAFCIRLKAHGKMSRALLAMRTRTVVSLQGPMHISSDITDLDADTIVMFAGGTGISPMLQILQSQVQAMYSDQEKNAGLSAAALVTEGEGDEEDGRCAQRIHPPAPLPMVAGQGEFVPWKLGPGFRSASRIHVVWQTNPGDASCALEDLLQLKAAMGGRMSLSCYFGVTEAAEAFLGDEKGRDNSDKLLVIGDEGDGEGDGATQVSTETGNREVTSSLSAERLRQAQLDSEDGSPPSGMLQSENRSRANSLVNATSATSRVVRRSVRWLPGKGSIRSAFSSQRSSFSSQSSDPLGPIGASYSRCHGNVARDEGALERELNAAAATATATTSANSNDEECSRRIIVVSGSAGFVSSLEDHLALAGIPSSEIVALD